MEYVKIRVTADNCKFDNCAAPKNAVIDGVKKLTAEIAAKSKLCVIIGDSELTAPKVVYKLPSQKVSEETTRPPSAAPKNTKEKEPKKTG